MSEGDWIDIESPDSQAIESSSGEEARGLSEANTVSTQDDQDPEIPLDHEDDETLRLDRKLSAEEVQRKASSPEIHHSALSSGFDHMTLDELETNKPPAPPPEPTHQAHFPNQYQHEPGHGRHSSPQAPELPDLHAAGDERSLNVRNPVSDTWREDAYEKLDRSEVTKMSDIEAKQDRWKCENCGVLNERGRGVCKKCGDRIEMPEHRYHARGDGEMGVRWNAMGIQFHKLKRDGKKKVEEGESATGERAEEA
ncbi:uncharacterized protein K460DRAFT_412576 [Cucurbitaria berberidis CBS 394.84]|uniref:RanBP2-type domain-containing protein n=1 Tax=Cucurbitaria berberidis CBS 394.84 TaxID=1168544 RepID=A0A9P4GQW2_9PLEO|nr:uncharacterized protein K460DRAFT_412576 [Cucurbitaria berberidis CBS 394.84]KAF1850948.1 hypothetical protein K460DRAFT_412576 [Cucurbitaria berberidis CBS 394.84]